MESRDLFLFVDSVSCGGGGRRFQLAVSSGSWRDQLAVGGGMTLVGLLL